MQPDVLTVREVAALLGISGQRVRQLIGAGDLPARRSSAGWLISADALASRERRGRGRPTSPRLVWAVLSMLSSAFDLQRNEAPWRVVPDSRLRHRALQLLARMPDPAEDPEQWRSLLASRGRVERMWSHPGLVPRLIDDPQIRIGGDRAAAPVGDSLSATEVRDLYIEESDADQVAAKYRLRLDPEGQVKLHVIPASVPGELAGMRGKLVLQAAAAADLLDEDDPRARLSATLQLGVMFHDLAEARRPNSASD